MVALSHDSRLPDSGAQLAAEDHRALMDRARRARDGFLPAHVIHHGHLLPLRPLAYPYSADGDDDA